MAGKTDLFGNGVLNILRGNPLTPPVAIYLGEFTTMPNDAGAGGVEPSGGGYARVQATLTAPSGRTTENTAEILSAEFTVAPGILIGWGFWDALTAGNLWLFDWLGSWVWRPFTADPTTDVFTSPAHGYTNGVQVVVSQQIAGTLPTGVSAGTIYYVVSATTDTFKVSATLGGGAINLTTLGSGMVRRISTITPGIGDRLRYKAGQILLVEF